MWPALYYSKISIFDIKLTDSFIVLLMSEINISKAFLLLISWYLRKKITFEVHENGDFYFDYVTVPYF